MGSPNTTTSWQPPTTWTYIYIGSAFLVAGHSKHLAGPMPCCSIDSRGARSAPGLETPIPNIHVRTSDPLLQNLLTPRAVIPCYFGYYIRISLLSVNIRSYSRRLWRGCCVGSTHLNIPGLLKQKVISDVVFDSIPIKLIFFGGY